MFFNSKIPAYLIDSENVGSTWTNLLQEGKKFDLYIFVTENAKSLNFSLLKELTNENSHRINIVECYPGKNSLDFYLSSYLGYLIGKNKHSSYLVVSQDTGFDHVIEYWNKEGYEVTRINTKPEKKKPVRRVRTSKNPESGKDSETRIIVKKEASQEKKENKKTVSKKKETKKKETAKIEKKSDKKELLKNLLKDYPENEIDDIAKLLDSTPADRRSDKNHIYRKLIRKYKNEKGLAIYSLIKKDLDKYFVKDNK
ncbi:MAG: hypothetical protein IKD94_06560 [Erysipelotrichaceae bacterium]|nr:hypothetical protein [Erysipelotrichaceae bacterium]